MADDAKQPQGPDLRKGVPLDRVREDTPLVGHVDGEAAMIVRLGQELFCIGATCTHYGGPLAEGLVVDDTVRCPWHHACFSLRTGAMLRPPALSSLPRWSVDVADGVVRAGDRLEEAEAPEAGAGPGGPPASVVILGGGAAGTAAALTLRQEGYDGSITMVSDDVDAPYDRPNASKDYLAGNASEEWMPLRPREWWDEKRIRLLLERSVDSIDAAARRLRLDDGEELEYGALLVATGAEPVRLDDLGPAGERIRYLRSWADSRAIIDAAEHAETAVVLGSSFIGMEVAAALCTRGLAVHVVSPDRLPLARVLGDDLGDYIRRLHERRGVRFHLEHTASEMEADAVILDDGRRIPCDLVVAGVGVRPRVRLLRDAGADVDNGVVVDEFLQTSLPDIWAAGDIAAWPDAYSGRRIRVEHWVVAERQGQTAARNMLGRRDRFDAVPFFWSHHYDEVAINYVGHAVDWDTAELDGDPDAKDCAVRFRREGKVLAVATIFRDRASLEAEVAMEHGVTR